MNRAPRFKPWRRTENLNLFGHLERANGWLTRKNKTAHEAVRLLRVRELLNSRFASV
jgi:hypothetical protein